MTPQRPLQVKAVKKKLQSRITGVFPFLLETYLERKRPKRVFSLILVHCLEVRPPRFNQKLITLGSGQE